MVKDREGFMWFGSWDGINRFDGHHFIAYKSSPGDLSPLQNSRIDQIVEDGAGHLWLEAYDKQVYRFDKRSSEFLPLSAIVIRPNNQKILFNSILGTTAGLVWIASANEGIFCVPQNLAKPGGFIQYQKGRAGFELPSNKIVFFHEDFQQNVWIGTEDGLCVLTRTKDSTFRNVIPIPLNVSAGIHITAFEEDKKNLYFADAAGDVITFDKGTASFSIQKLRVTRLNFLLRSKNADLLYVTTSGGEVIAIDVNNQKATSVKYSTGEPLHSIVEEKNGNLWIEPDTLGAILYKTTERAFQYFSTGKGEGANYAASRFRVLQDGNGKVWVNMKGGGFGYFNEEKNSVDNFVVTPDAVHQQLPKLINRIYYDKSGILWLTTYDKEVIKIVLQGNNFHQQLMVDKGFSMSDNEVRGMLYDNRGRLWIGAKSGKLYTYQNNKRLSGLFDNEPAAGLGLVYSMLQDNLGNIWFGTKGNGLFRASPVKTDGSRYHLTHFETAVNNPNGLQCNEIYALLQNKEGRILIGSYDKGLQLINPVADSGKLFSYSQLLSGYPKEKYQKIRHIMMDEKGLIWIATTDGLVIMKPLHNDSGKYNFTTYNKIPGDRESLGNNDIQYIFRDSKNRVWLATSGGGLGLVIQHQSSQNLRFRNYTIREGMPNDYVLSCAEDNNGQLWIATENGLTKFDPNNNTFRNYDAYDALPKASFSEASVCVENKKGILFFGTTKGYLSFEPDSMGSKKIEISIAFTNLQINNANAGPGMEGMALPANINYLSELTLQYDQNIISIDYALLDHRAGYEQPVAYRLIGFDSAWHDDLQLRRATYTNLPVGKYYFEVKSLSNDLYVNAPSRRLSITILPPPWKTWWAYCLYLLVIIFTLAFIRRTAIAIIRLRQKIALEEKLAAIKLEFFTNISHELRTPLTLILSPIEQILKKEKLSDQGRVSMEVAQKNANRMVRFINQLLDLRKAQSKKAELHYSRIELVDFLNRVGEYFKEEVRTKNIKLEIFSSNKEVIASVDANKLDVVIYNVLGNAVKFTPAGRSIQILVEELRDDQSFIISVCDQGPGVQHDKLEQIFELFHEGEQSLLQKEKGTGIGLAFAKELVSLHGGLIWAVNNKDGGLTVMVKMKTNTNLKGDDKSSPVLIAGNQIVKTPFIEKEGLAKQQHEMITPTMSKPLLLLVEDNDELRSMLQIQLTEFYRVESASNGQEGFEKAVQNLPDLIVSDIMMPVMNGIQMLDKVKNHVNTSHIPVVLLSAKYSIESQVEGMRYGADYYITKPFSNEFLLAAIDNLLAQRKKLFQLIVDKKDKAEIEKAKTTLTAKDEAFLQDVLRIVENRMPDPEFNIDLVAESLAMSRSTFYKKFRSLTSLAPVEFVKDVRLRQGMQYLDTGNYNISEIAYMVGFSNPKYFSTCFREKYNISPTDYQKSRYLPETTGI